MKNRFLLIAVCLMLVPLCAFGQEETEPARNYIGVNVAHTLIIELVSTSFGPTVEYLPLHVIYQHAFDDTWGLSALAFYRMDRDANFLTDEFGFAVGPRLSFAGLKGLFVDCKLGLGFASGNDYLDNGYSRIDLVIEPDVGYTFLIGTHFALTIGVGLQTLICISETPARDGSWDWNDLGQLSHYYLPAANLTVAFVF